MGVVVVMCITAFLELVGVGAILPFLNMLTDPSVTGSSSTLQSLYTTFGFTDDTLFFLAVAIGVLGILIFTQIFIAFSVWIQTRLVFELGHTISLRMMKNYLGKPYPFFLGNNSSQVITRILGETKTLANGILEPGLTLISKTLVACAIVALLLYVEPLITITVIGFVGGVYAFIYVRIKRKVRRLGDQRHHVNRERLKVAQEAFGGIKEAKVLGIEQSFMDRYEIEDRIFTKTGAQFAVYLLLPGYFIRALTFAGLMTILLAIVLTGRNTTEALPTMGLFVFAGYRLMPAFENIIGSLAKFRFNGQLLELIYNETQHAEGRPELPSRRTTPLVFSKQIRLERVSYCYPGTEKPILKDLEVTIGKNTTVALVGETGAGKTTIIDLILGLLRPTEGKLLVDNVELAGADVSRWQRNIGYIPQEIYLADTSIACNIAFGLPHQEIDMEKVKRAARIAHIHEFVSSLPAGYDTAIGERGIRVSGGQRQRIGIARALYHDPAVLVMDEATSDIDNVTEASITEAINDLSGQKTLIVVAHRIATVRACDVIHVVDDGRIIARGTFGELLDTSPHFRALASHEPHSPQQDHVGTPPLKAR